jgi:hypothetical protein
MKKREKNERTERREEALMYLCELGEYSRPPKPKLHFTGHVSLMLKQGHKESDIGMFDGLRLS